MRFPRLKMSGFWLSVLISIFVAILLFIGSDLALFESLELKTLDLRFKIRGQKKVGSEIVIVALDDKSIERIGRWPWPRSRIADLINKISAGKPRAVGFDIIFSEPEVSADLKQFRMLRENYSSLGLERQNDQGRRFSKLLEALEKKEDNDYLLGEAVRGSGSVVLAMFFDGVDAPANGVSRTGKPAPLYLRKSEFKLVKNKQVTRLIPPISATNITAPLEVLGRSAQAVGHANMKPDIDGVARWEILLVQYPGSYYPSFALQVARTYLGLSPEEMIANFGEGIDLTNVFVPTDERMRMLINYNGYANTFPRYSFVDVLEGRVPPQTFQGKAVLVGATATGLHDQKVTPLSKALPGVEKHANVVENIIHGSFLERANWMTFLDLFFVLLFGLGSGVVLSRLPKFWGPVFSLALLGGYFYFAYAMFAGYRIWLNLIYPSLSIVLCFVGVISYRFMTEEREKRKVKGAFQQYLNPSVVNEVLKNPQMLKLGGDKKELTVLFSDIRGFTSVSEKLEPEALVHLLNEYLTAMTDLILAKDGLLDKYMGDAIMAVFGAPIPQPDHAHRACTVALEMLAELKRLQTRWNEQNIPVLDIGVGVNTGSMVVGNMGSSKRFDYTVMGDSVNLGSRLEGANKQYHTNVIISEFTQNAVKGAFRVRELDSVRVMGKKLPVRIYELRGKSDAYSPEEGEFLRIYTEGMGCYKDRQWERAIDSFTKALGIYPADGVCKLYVERCQDLIVEPPPVDWDGVFEMKTK
ncbi:MAG: adenylate/guanylate cyclase domain-containing protein [Candidatus Tectomicrobia bacterium]|uniref:Adenylate/guanylate cyclase domain-containing protein n=1 Tax=Tectimicrobiota bacterium TaxID=2528274 RepID=A0A932LZZ5_UNCTE|nr:adenylate/guanylate cyclase domain-containing protein [Candidatus Tectomicrobia bacterium]